jgi:hypothetical protein
MTSAPFVTGLRTSGDVISLAAGGEPVMHIRVQVADLWDSVRIDSPPTEPVISVKRAALEALYPSGIEADEFVVRLRGFEILDEGTSLADAGVGNGSILLLVGRRRKPVR